MIIIDTLLRGGAIGVITIVAGIMLARRLHVRQSISFAVAGFSVSCYLLASSPALASIGRSFDDFLSFVAGMAPLPVTWMVLEVFYDRPLQRWYWLMLAAAIGLSAVLAQSFEWASMLRGILALALYGGFLFIALVTADDDLVEKRRAFRRGFVLILAMMGCAITIVELVLPEQQVPDWVFLLQSCSILLIALVSANWAMTASPDIWPAPDVSARLIVPDDPVAERLLGLMKAGLWRREGLTIGDLSNEVGVPEHRLRVVINRQLGHRNFSTFVNGYRISAAQEILSDPLRRDETILQIAHDLGYGSLGPFNRAFRAHTGQSPSQFRTNYRRS